LLKGDKPFVPSEGQAVGMTFYPMETIKDSSGRVLAPGGEPFSAALDPETGTFEVPGPDGRGIPAGKYRVAVSLRQRTAPPNSSGKKFDRDKDLLQDRFNDKASPIIREITTKSDLTIDLEKPTG
jgi:hypothetical protein